MLNFFEHLNPFYDSCFMQFSYTYWNTSIDDNGQNPGYESRFDAIISNHPYWNYHGFSSDWGTC